MTYQSYNTASKPPIYLLRGERAPGGGRSEDDAWCSPAPPGEALVEAESRHEAAVLVDREARQDGLPTTGAMEGAVVAAEAVPQRDDAQRADLVESFTTTRPLTRVATRRSIWRRERDH